MVRPIEPQETIRIKGSSVLSPILTLVLVLAIALPVQATSPDLSGRGRPGDRGGGASHFGRSTEFIASRDSRVP